MATPHSCAVCKTEFLIQGKHRAYDVFDPSGPSGISSGPLQVKDWKAFAATGCDFARYVVERITSELPDVAPDTPIIRYPPDRDEGYKNVLAIGILNQTYAMLTYFAEPESVVACEVAQRPPNSEPGSGASFNLIRKWLAECVGCHQYNPTSERGFMPTRVVEVLSSRSEVYVRQNPSPGPYAVLSYCWGGPQGLSLTKAQSNPDGWAIPRAALPETLRDAVRVAEELGLGYLWVDALCIVQDDPRDKATQIGHMADIYQNSHVAIMASRAKSVDEGFLHPRHPFGVASSSRGFRIPYQSEDGRLGTVVAIEQDSSIAYTNPLQTRGWAFQELILSPRIIHYGAMGTEWVCHGSGTLSDGFSSPLHLLWCRREFNELCLEGGLDGYSGVPSQLWSALVINYTGGELTYSRDRLPALAGLAQRMASLTGDQYLAGCWKRTIWEGLMWRNPHGRNYTRAPGYFAPSWSWASVPDCDVMYISTRHSLVDEAFHVLDANTEPLSQASRYGEVTYGSLKVRARVFFARYFFRNKDPFLGKVFNSIDGWEGAELENFDAQVYPDALLEHEEEGDIPLSFLCVCWDWKRSKLSGIALREHEDALYVRWGLFSIWFKPNPLSEGKETEAAYAYWRRSLPIETLIII